MPIERLPPRSREVLRLLFEKYGDRSWTPKGGIDAFMVRRMMVERVNVIVKAGHDDMMEAIGKNRRSAEMAYNGLEDYVL